MLRQRHLLIILIMLLLALLLFLLSRHELYSLVSTSPDVSVSAPVNDSVDPSYTMTYRSVVDKPNKSAYQLWQEIDSLQTSMQQRFKKVAMNGELLAEDALHWDCVFDQMTNLLWEVKQNDGGWQDNQHTYSWYEPPLKQALELVDSLETNPISELEEESDFGVADKGDCLVIACDTHSYQQAVNEQWLCSSSDWRLPESHELGMLDHLTNYNPDIDTDYFPNTQGYYWARTDISSMKTLAWSVDFSNGIPYIVEKRMAYHVRLVTESAWLADEIKKATNNLQ